MFISEEKNAKTRGKIKINHKDSKIVTLYVFVRSCLLFVFFVFDYLYVINSIAFFG